MTKGPEAEILRLTRAALTAAGWYVVRISPNMAPNPDAPDEWTARGSVRGTPDLLVCAGGRFVGIELNPAYAEMAARRIGEDLPLLNRGAA